MNRSPPWFDSLRRAAASYSPPRFEAKTTDKRARLYLYDAIGRDLWGSGIDPRDVVAALAEAKAGGAKALDVYMNSPGGYVFDGLAIYNEIRRWDGPTTTYVDGLAGSIASVIALAADRVVTAPAASWMVHSAWGVFVGNARDAAKFAEDLSKMDGILLDTYVRETGATPLEVRAWMDTDTWMTPAEAKERGFTDEITEEAPARKSAKVADARVALLTMQNVVRGIGSRRAPSGRSAGKTS